MKCQCLYSGKNKNNISKCHPLTFLPSMLSVKSEQQKEKCHSLKKKGKLPWPEYLGKI